MVAPNVVKQDNIAKVLDRALDKGEGLPRLTPTWVPRSFLHPRRRIKLHRDDLYAYGANRDGIDDRWFASTTEAANEGRVWNDGLSFASFEGKQLFSAKSHEAATGGVEIENIGSEPFVGLRYVGPDCHKKVPQLGDFKKR